MGFRASNEACVACSQACWASKQTLVTSKATEVFSQPYVACSFGTLAALASPMGPVVLKP